MRSFSAQARREQREQHHDAECGSQAEPHHQGLDDSVDSHRQSKRHRAEQQHGTFLVTSSSRWSVAVGLTNCLYMSRENRVAELSSKLQAVETSAAHRAASVMPDNTGFNDMMTSGKAEAAATLGKLALIHQSADKADRQHHQATDDESALRRLDIFGAERNLNDALQRNIYCDQYQNPAEDAERADSVGQAGIGDRGRQFADDLVDAAGLHDALATVAAMMPM